MTTKEIINADVNRSLYKVAEQLIENIPFTKSRKIAALMEIDKALQSTPLETKIKMVLEGMNAVNQICDKYVEIWMKSTDPEIKAMLMRELSRQKIIYVPYSQTSSSIGGSL